MKGIQRTTAILVALMLLFGALAPVAVQAEARDIEESATPEITAPETETTETTGREPRETADGNTLAAQGVPVRKPFTVTKRPANDLNAQEERVDDYDSFYEAMNACVEDDQQNLYTVTMNGDYTISAAELHSKRSGANILLRSAGNQPSKLATEKAEPMIDLTGSTLRTQNIVFDGNNKSQFLTSKDSTVTLGADTVVQQFIDTPTGSSNDDGPAIHLEGKTTLTVENEVVITDNQSDQENGRYAGVIYAADQSTVNIQGGTFTNNQSTKRTGGVIRSAVGAKVNISGGTFQNNTAEGVGGVIQADGDVNISGGIFEGNKGSIGGVVHAKGNVTIENATFRSNTANNAGVVASTKDLTIKESHFENNEADNWGGAIFTTKDATIENSTFTSNEAKQGGAIQSQGSMTIENSKFTSNTAGKGGAVYAESSTGTVTFKNDTFTSNKATEDGGAIYTVPKTTIEKTTFETNEAASGGAIYAFYNIQADKGSDLTITESKFLNNLAKKDGGAIYDMLYQYAYTIDNAKAYRNVKTDEKTLFQGNTAGNGLFTPPQNHGDFTDLKFDSQSDVDHGKLTKKSLLNNYDINHQNDRRLITYDANRGEFADGSTIKTEEPKVGTNIKIMEAPTRSGYFFLHWQGSDGKPYRPGAGYTVKEHHTFVAQWRREGSPSAPPTVEKTVEKIIVDPNGGTFSDGTTGRKTYDFKAGETFLLPAAPTREGYKFIAWQGKDAEYQPGYPYVVKSGGEVFTARWEEEKKHEKKPEEKPSVTPKIKTPKGTPLTPNEIAKILAGMKKTVPAIPKAGVGR